MVNQTILDYLIQNYNKYSLESIKAKILNSGYAKKDFDEALSVFLKKSPASQSSSKISLSKIKWMKISAIIGLVLLFLALIKFVLSMFIEVKIPGTLAIVILVPLVLSGILYLYGFVRLGSHTSRLLKFSSWVSIIMTILLLIAYFVLYAYAATFVHSSIPTTRVAAVSAAPSPLWFTILFFSIIAVFLAIFALFNSGLIIAGKQVKFAKLSGILSLIYMGLIIASIVCLILYIRSDPLGFLTLIFSSQFKLIITLISVFLFLASSLIILLNSLALFDASKQFEK